jgi:hypothetical protein
MKSTVFSSTLRKMIRGEKLKKITLSLLAMSVAMLMICSAYAVPIAAVATPIDAPCFCCTCCDPGFTPGFWRHNIQVRLHLTNGKYSAFEGGPFDGVKLNDAAMDYALELINAYLGSSYTFEQLLDNLNLKGWNEYRTNTANWFNFVAGYGPY